MMKTKEELIEEAKKRFPRGSTFTTTNIIQSCRDVVTIADGEFSISGLYPRHITYDESSSKNSSFSYTIYQDGQWAIGSHDNSYSDMIKFLKHEED